jgi:hypothetical protein
MHPAVSLLVDNAANNRMLLAPLLFSVCASVANVHEPVQHSLLITTISWAILWLYTLLKVGIRLDGNKRRRATCWLAGACLAFAQFCDRAAADKEGTWATKVRKQLQISEKDILNLSRVFCHSLSSSYRGRSYSQSSLSCQSMVLTMMPRRNPIALSTLLIKLEHMESWPSPHSPRALRLRYTLYRLRPRLGSAVPSLQQLAWCFWIQPSGDHKMATWTVPIPQRLPTAHTRDATPRVNFGRSNKWSPCATSPLL